MTFLAPSFLIGSSSFVQVMRTCIKAWMSSNSGQMPPLTTELAPLERLKNQCLHFFSVAIDLNLLNFRVTRTYIISWISENFGQI